MGGVGNGANVHVLMVPFPASGHDLALMDLAHQLILRGVAITILVTPKNLPSLNPILSLHPTITTLVLPFPSDPSSKMPSGIEHMKDLPLYEFIHPMIDILGKLYDPLLHWFQNHPSPPTAIISDFFVGTWTNRLALHLGIPRVTFSPLSAHSVAEWWAASYRDEESYISSIESWGMVFNTFLELDQKHLDTIKRVYLKHDRAWAIGPLPSIRMEPVGKGGPGPYSVPENDIIAWLDLCQVDGSVVYVAFGTQAIFNRKQMEVIAGALEESGVKFVWVVKEPVMKGKDVPEAHDQNAIPAGFEDRTAGRGLVIRGWAPQLAIINHRAVGCYFSHCGWNSVLEGLQSGLSLLVWPMVGDNFANGRLLADELGVAIKVCEDERGVPDQQYLAKTLAESVSGKRPERVRALELREKALKAVKPGGNSYKALDELVEALSSFKQGSPKS